MATGNGLAGFMNSEMRAAVRRDRIYKGLEKMPLSCFTFGEFRILRRFIENRGCSETDIVFIEGKIAEFESKSVSDRLRSMFCRNCGANIRNDSDHRC